METENVSPFWTPLPLTSSEMCPGATRDDRLSFHNTIYSILVHLSSHFLDFSFWSFLYRAKTAFSSATNSHSSGSPRMM